MLEFKKVKHPDLVVDYLRGFDPQTTTWIVSDLKSKQEIQQICLDKFGYYSDESILRISDFWKLWLRRFAPQIKVVSSDFMQVLVNQYIEIYGSKLGEFKLDKHDGQTLYRYMTDLAPLVIHKPSHDTLKDWLLQKPEQSNWAKWEIIAQNCLQYILNEHLCIENRWIVSFLQTLDIDKIIWPKKIVFDLNSQMTSLEMGIIKILAQKNDLEILVPDPHWRSKFNYILRTYEDYSGYARKKDDHEKTIGHDSYTGEQFKRFNTEINEIKFATEKVRQWIAQGVSPDKIAILSPRIEDYWPILKYHFDAEGIPSRKDTVNSVMSLGVVQRWLSYIQMQTQDVSWNHLEISFDYLQEKQIVNVNFEKFRSLFYEMLDAEDLQRLSEVSELLRKKVDMNSKLKQEQFLVLMLQAWIKLDPQLNFKKTLQNIVKDFIQQTLPITLMGLDWYELLTTRLAKKEIKSELAVKNGVDILPVTSAQVLGATHRIWMGLDESGLRGRQNSLIPIADIEELKRVFDLAIDYPEESHAEFNLRWYSMVAAQEQYFTCATVSMLGEPLNASLFFLENNKHSTELFESYTVLDSMQDGFKLEEQRALFDKLQRETQATAIAIKDLKFLTLSPSDIESYSQCSFKFLARKAFALKQYDSLGLEIDPRQKGNLIHNLFKYIVDNKNYLNIQRSELENYLDEERVKQNLFPQLDVFWAPHREKLVQVGLKFSEYEKKRLMFMPDIKHKVESVLKFYYDMSRAEFVADAPLDNYYAITGRVDRYDYIESTSQAVVIDYKSAKSDRTSFAGDWVDNSEFQLMIYSLAIEKVFSIKVVGGLYYFYKDFSHKYGYLLSENNHMLNVFEPGKKTLIDSAKQIELYQSFNARIKEILESISKNQYNVKPKDIKICDTCEWINVCRIKNQN